MNLIVCDRIVSGFSNSSRASSERRRSSSNHGVYLNPSRSRDREAGIFTMDDISKATRNFSPSLKIGQGGFGTVYKGILGDGATVAIKRAKKVKFA